MIHYINILSNLQICKSIYCSTPQSQMFYENLMKQEKRLGSGPPIVKYQQVPNFITSISETCAFVQNDTQVRIVQRAGTAIRG